MLSINVLTTIRAHYQVFRVLLKTDSQKWFAERRIKQ